MGWHARLSLHYHRDGERCIAHDRHHGPLRVLQRLYPEGPGICHHVLVHPPGGVVAGDVLELDAALDAHTHALITTPGATRFYRSTGEQALQSATVKLSAGARLEWLPMEAIAYRGCKAENRLRCLLEPDAEMIGWDVLALGLPAAGEAFDSGQFRQHLELPGAWLERGLIDASDTRLLDSPLGLARHRALATMWFAAGSALAPARRDALLDAAREATQGHVLAPSCGATAPHAQVVLLRVLAPRVEPAMRLLQAVWARWRATAWHIDATPPRVWST